MQVGEVCNRNVVVIEGDQSVLAAARLMREYRVGDVVVVEERGGRNVPIGIFTDRDVAIEVLADEVDPKSIAVKDAMSYELVTVSIDDGIPETVKFMREKRVRRIPVVDKQGALAGILTIDDVLDLLAETLTDIAHLVAP
ncbi:MAG: CBS domain-containing protein [Gammaproteobacteria bacterium]|nr:CBS domain-containing protein [Gammaproteobacteria bacterium]